MDILIAVPLACWLCALLAIPRKPLVGNEVQELVYARLLGRHQRVLLLALLASLLAFAAFIIRLPGSVPVAVADAPDRRQVLCASEATGLRVCWVEHADGMWAVEREQADGGTLIEGYVSMPPSAAGVVSLP